MTIGKIIDNITNSTCQDQNEWKQNRLILIKKSDKYHHDQNQSDPKRDKIGLITRKCAPGSTLIGDMNNRRLYSKKILKQSNSTIRIPQGIPSHRWNPFMRHPFRSCV